MRIIHLASSARAVPSSAQFWRRTGGIAATVLALASSAAWPSGPADNAVEMRDCSGRPTDLAHSGQCLIFRVTGFAPDELVRARFLSAPERWHSIRSNAQGTVEVEQTLPDPEPVATDILTITGSDDPTAVGTDDPAPDGNVVVTVPRFVVHRFAVGDAVTAPADPTGL